MEALSFGPEDVDMIDHIVDVIGDRIRSEDGYTEQDKATLDKLERLRDISRSGPHTVGLVLTLAEEADEGRA